MKCLCNVSNAYSVCNFFVSLFAEKISDRRKQDGDTGPKPNSAIEEFCDRFDRAVKNTASAQVTF